MKPSDHAHAWDNFGESRFETEILGHSAYLKYHKEDSIISLLHTEVPEELRGYGLANSLSRFALEYARAAGLKVRIICPAVGRFLRKHLEYADLIERATSLDAVD